MPRATRRVDRPVPRAAGPRRRLLPGGAAAVAGAHARAAALPAVVPRRVRPPGAGRSTAGVARRTRAGPHQRRVSRPSAPPRAVAVVAAGGAAGAVLRWLLGEVVAGRRRLPVDHVRDQRRRLVRARAAARAARSYAGASSWRSPSGPGCSAGSPRCPTYAEQGRGLLADGRTGPRRGVPARHAGRLPGRRRPGAPAVDAGGPAGVRRRGGQRVTVLLVALGGGVGAALRFLVAHHLDARVPWGTLAGERGSGRSCSASAAASPSTGTRWRWSASASAAG